MGDQEDNNKIDQTKIDTQNKKIADYQLQISSDDATIQKLYNDDYNKTLRLMNDNEKKLHEEKLNIVNNTKNLLKSKSNLLNLSREIDINDEEFKFRNNISKILGIIITIGIIITLVIVCNYMISGSSGKVARLKAIFG